jgi:hypothetical protein
MKINFSKYIKYWQTYVEMAEVFYINIYHSTMIEKLQNGEKNEWAKTSI